MKFIFSLSGIALAVFIQGVLGGFSFYLNPPLIIFAIIISFWSLGTRQRLWLSMIAGIILDSIYSLPFGTHIMIGIGLSFLTTLLQYIFTNINSLFTKAVSTGLAMFIIITLTYPLAFLINYFRGLEFILNARLEGVIILYALVWSILCPCIFFGSISLIKKAD